MLLNCTFPPCVGRVCNRVQSSTLLCAFQYPIIAFSLKIKLICPCHVCLCLLLIKVLFHNNIKNMEVYDMIHSSSCLSTPRWLLLYSSPPPPAVELSSRDSDCLECLGRYWSKHQYFNIATLNKHHFNLQLERISDFWPNVYG